MSTPQQSGTGLPANIAGALSYLLGAVNLSHSGLDRALDRDLGRFCDSGNHTRSWLDHWHPALVGCRPRRSSPLAILHVDGVPGQDMADTVPGRHD
jgi:hypothetical protein